MKVFKKAFFEGYESYRSISEAVKYFQTLKSRWLGRGEIVAVDDKNPMLITSLKRLKFQVELACSFWHDKNVRCFTIFNNMSKVCPIYAYLMKLSMILNMIINCRHLLRCKQKKRHQKRPFWKATNWPVRLLVYV